MRRNRTSASHKETPTTPNSHQTFSNNNNDSHSAASNQNPIIAKELKIRTLLKELQLHVKNSHNERENSEPNLTVIEKTHEKIRKEEKVTSFFRKKLRQMYATSLKESESEIKCLRQALDCINQVRLIQTEIRLLQQQQNSSGTPTNSILLSPSAQLNTSQNMNNSFTSQLNKMGANFQTPPDSKSSKKSSTMRRGVLMSILQQAALTLPLWIGEIGQAPPALCGSMPPESSYICKPGDKVAAIVKNSNSGSNPNSNTGGAEEESDEENWILAEVVTFHSNTGKYDVDDIDAEEGEERHTLGKKKVVPLPLWRANPLTDPEAISPKDSVVLALYPQTTCFYRGIIAESPQTPLEDYLILFEDNTYPEGYSPPLNVPQLYVVLDRSLNKK